MTKQTDAEVLRAMSKNIGRPNDVRRAILARIAARLESDDRRYADSEKLQDIGRGCAEYLADMVAALECDYERLEELRDYFAEASNYAHADAGSVTEDRAELAELETAAGECESRDDAEQRIHEDPLSIELSGTWSAGDTPTADKAIILLGTGGPATRIVCELDEHMEPHRAWIQAQDWFTPWTDYTGGAISRDDLLTYCRQFYFGG